ncbi:unnamed protein product [Oppiella nova]|uniref:Epoxide hydrolase n=1 Tax=Oppiella nova TaxID=334625 RepID=A0A7R9M3J8_9ACAR|nr:unnamed protein product [Oppiella nova]CAG2170108.1 unnamed protein product [Oppiella nova]
MGVIKKLLLIGVVVGIGAVIYPLVVTPQHKLPELKDKWFGKTPLKSGEAFPKESVAIDKFVVNVSEDVLTDLKRRLESARYVEPIAGTAFNYGFNSDYLKKVIAYWRNTYDWRKTETILNQFPQFKTRIHGIDVHFIHVKPSKPAKTVVPLLITHGWPGSVWEYYKAIPLLIEPTNGVAFEVIVPSIPGYGFSEAPHQEGFNIMETARIFVKLMNRLNHKTFFVHGEDWGSIVSKTMAQLYPNNVRGMHITMAQLVYDGPTIAKMMLGSYFPALVFDDPERDHKKLFPFLDQFYMILRESGYFHLQATKPDTVGAALMDSPVGLAAYILEKFSTWTEPKWLNKADGGLTQKFTLDELLTNIMIYWVSNNVASSMRYYKENAGLLMDDMNKIPVLVPSAVADFPNELGHAPKALLRTTLPNLVQYTDMPRGGHFAAFEEPQLVCDDIKTFVATVLDIELSAKDKLKNTKQ